MKRVQIGTAPVPPERPVGALSSKPSHVSVSVFGVKPMNHASRLSFVVPVLPAATRRKPIERAPRRGAAIDDALHHGDEHVRVACRKDLHRLDLVARRNHAAFDRR